MHILISNDDGVFSEGLHALVEQLHQHYDITVVAPEEQQSGKSHATTFTEPVRVRSVTLHDLPDVRAYAATGTPADCVRLGCTSFGFRPDLVITGINHGANLGTHVLYSGTVGAAMEAALFGVQAIATSCCHWRATDFSAAARASLWAADYVRRNPLPPYMILNLNSPHLPIDEIKGIRLTGLHMQEYDGEHSTFEDPLGRKFYWMTFQEREPVAQTWDTDLRWIEEGYVTLTPIHCDIACYDYMRTMKIGAFDLSRLPTEDKNGGSQP